jgi:hypothetical protein
MTKWILLILAVMLFVSSCGFISPTVITGGHIPPSLTHPRLVYGCNSIINQMKLATCYLKSRKALYLANQDKKSLKKLDKEWSD